MIGRLCALSKHEADQRLHGLSGVGIDSPGSDWPLGGFKTQWNPLHSRTPPTKSARLLDVIFPFLSPLSIFSFSFLFIYLFLVIFLLLLLPLRPLLLLLL